MNDQPGNRNHCCRLFLVSGRVQGVFFRASTQQQALHFGLAGWAKNLADGSVEVLACGQKEALNQLADWLHKGPRLARVDHLSEQSYSGDAPDDFSIS